MIDLKDLLAGVEFVTKDDISGLEVKGVADDSRNVDKEDIFIAINGYSIDGHLFIDEAIEKGAKAILAEKDFDPPTGITKILVDDARIALPMIANNFYRHPSGKIKVIGVTGTNGKTTVTYLIESILSKAKKEAGVIGTVNYRFKDKRLSSNNTTPGPLELQALLRDMVDEALPYAIMEVSSHSLDQHRVDGISFDTAIFTNVTHEHLDYHKTFEDYFNAKAKLFDRLKDGGVSVLNSDDENVASLKARLKGKVMTYGFKMDADVRAERLRLSLDGSSFTLVTPKGSIEVETKLIGKHNISNILAGVAASVASGIDLETIRTGVESLEYIPGRLERIGLSQPFKVFVDYAHTEDALYNVLSLLRKQKRRGIITVFGCGGNRDRKKRPLMGEVACVFSDKVIITSDNPRFEELHQIINDIEKGIKGRYSNYEIIEDRHEAIEKGLRSASKDDIVLIAGKGHERCQIIKGEEMPFDDREVARSILRKLKAREGPRDIKDNKRPTALR